MAQLIEVTLSTGEKIFVEATGSNLPGGSTAVRGIGKGLDVIEKIDEVFDKAIQNVIVQNSLILVKAFKEMESHPLPLNKASVEFGLKVSGKGNIYVVESSAEASFKITLEWLPSTTKK